MEFVLGIDVGGTAIKHALVDIQGNLSRFGSVPTPQNDPEARELLNAVQAIVETYAVARPLALGVAIPGLVNAAGIAEFSGTLGFRNLDVLGLLTSSVTIPVALIHDVTAGGLAEATLGAAKGTTSAVLLQIGTALAASIILQGEVYHPHPAVGEIGHAPTVYDRPCPCGLRGCLEMSASGGALSRNYEQLSGEKITAQEVFSRAAAGDEDAIAVLNEFVDALSQALVWLSAIIGPDLIIISGGISEAGDSLVEALEKELDKKMSIHKRPRLAVSPLTDAAGVTGAGLQAWQLVT